MKDFDDFCRPFAEPGQYRPEFIDDWMKVSPLGCLDAPDCMPRGSTAGAGFPTILIRGCDDVYRREWAAAEVGRVIEQLQTPIEAGQASIAVFPICEPGRARAYYFDDVEQLFAWMEEDEQKRILFRVCAVVRGRYLTTIARGSRLRRMCDEIERWHVGGLLHG